MRVLRDYEGSAEVKDYIDVARRTGMVTQSASMLKGFDEEELRPSLLDRI